MKNKNVCLAVFAMSLAAAMSASASLTISGSEFNTGDVSYSVTGSATAGYDSTSPGYANLHEGSADAASVTVTSAALGGASLGTLADLISAGQAGNMSFYLSSITGGGTANNGNEIDSAFWVIKLSNGNTYLALADGNTGPNYFDQGNSVSYWNDINNSRVPINPSDGTSTWASLSGSLDVVSVGVEIGDWNAPNGGSMAFTAEISSITLAPVPEPSTMVWGGLLLLPIGASTIRMLRRRKNQGLGMTA